MGKKKRKKPLRRQEDKKQQAAVEAPAFKRPDRKVPVLGLLAAAFLVFIAAFLVYQNTLQADFIWDDEYLILNNTQIKSFSHLPNVFKTYVGYGSENINNFYRPIQELSNMLDYFLWGEKAFGFHLTNVILQASVGVVVLVFLYMLCGDLMAALVGALFWVVHPVHTEAISYIAGRADPLYAFFALLSICAFILYVSRVEKAKKAQGFLGYSLLLFCLAILAKEIILVMPLLIFLYIYFFVRKTGVPGLYRKVRFSWAPFAGITAIYVWLRLTVLDFSHIAPPSAFGRIPLFLRLLTFFRSIGVYIKLMIFPVDLHMERAIPISRSIFQLSSMLALGMVGLIVFIAVRAYKKDRLVSFCIAWFFANLLPVSNIVPINSFLAEHWIYMASIGPFFLVGLAVSRGFKSLAKRGSPLRWVLPVLVVFLVGAYGAASARRNLDWKDEVSFFNSTLKFHPRNARLYLNLGNTYFERGEVDEAVKQYRKAIDINPRYAVAYGNIGSAYLNQKQPKKAEEYLRKAIAIKDNYPIAHYNLGIIYAQSGRTGPAIQELSIATSQLPQFYQAWNMLGRMYMKKGRTDLARKAFEKSLSISPDQERVVRILRKLSKKPHENPNIR